MSAILSQEEIDRLAGSISDSLTDEASPNGKGVLSQEEINRITNSLGIDEDIEMKEDEPEAAMPTVLSQEEIDKLASPEPPVSGGGTLSQEEIDRLSSMDSEPVASPPAGGGMLTQEEINRLASTDSEAVETPPSGGGMLTQEEINRLASTDSEAVETPPSGGGMLTQEEINRLAVGDTGESVAEVSDTPVPVETLTQEELDRLSVTDGGDSSDIKESEEATSEIRSDAIEESDKSWLPFNINYKMVVIIGVPVLVLAGLTLLITQIFFSDAQPSATPVESGFAKVPADNFKKNVNKDSLIKGVNLFMDSIVRDGIEATVEKSKELFYTHKLRGTEDSLKKSFAFDLSASLVIKEKTDKSPIRFSIEEMRKRFVPAIRKSNSGDDLESETLMLDWGRAVIKGLKAKKRDKKTS